MEIYREKFTLGDKEPGAGELFRIIQSVSTTHCDMLGLGESVIAQKGLVWMAARQYLRLTRGLRPGETVELQTWPGKNRHALVPRYYLMSAPGGEALGEGCVLWTMVDARERRMVVPDSRGFEAAGLTTGRECRLPSAPGRLPLTDSAAFTVPEEYLDENGHMNNTRYYELAERCIGSTAAGLRLRCAVTEFISEALMGDEMTVRWGGEGGSFYICGESRAPVFKMRLDYGE